MLLNVCVCGWHYPDGWYASLLRLHSSGKVKVEIVANRIHPLLSICELPYVVRQNTGLEWGAYNHYLMHLWDGGGVVFCHDDMSFIPVLTQENKLVSGEELLPSLNNLNIDHGYVFSTRMDDATNYGKHGRMLFISDKLCAWIRENGGIWSDPAEGWPENYNSGVQCFTYLVNKAAKAGFDVDNKIYFPGLSFGHRGEFKGRKINGNNAQTDGFYKSGGRENSTPRVVSHH